MFFFEEKRRRKIILCAIMLPISLVKRRRNKTNIDTRILNVKKYEIGKQITIKKNN